MRMSAWKDTSSLDVNDCCKDDDERRCRNREEAGWRLNYRRSLQSAAGSRR